MDDSTLVFLRRVYREHYFKRHNLLEIPTQMQGREFGYIPFGGGMIRHLSFKSPGELVAELVKQAPSSVYCSNAVYERPTLQMDEKGWLGAELIFDIDADSISTPCKAKHNWWFCGVCNKGGMGAKPAKCPNCRSSGLSQVQWSCKECLDATKEHLKRLTAFLTRDFGVDKSQIHLYFSGNRGYHARVTDERFARADSQMRAELADYIRGNGLNPRFSPVEGNPAVGNPLGWKTRIDRLMLSSPSTHGKRQTEKLTEQIVNTNAAFIDESVTTDIHRVFRMPGTLHGNSGLLKMKVESIDDFDPQKDPVVLGRELVKTRIYFAPEFYLNGLRFGPYDSASVQIPIYAAVFLIARGFGQTSSG